MSTLTDKAIELLAYLDKNEKPLRRDDGQPTVSELLTQSRAQHQIYRRSLSHRANGIVIDGNPVAAAEALASSARLRAIAEIHDPQHADTAWADDKTAKFPHEAMIDFYAEEAKRLVPSDQLAIEDALADKK